MTKVTEQEARARIVEALPGELRAAWLHYEERSKSLNDQLSQVMTALREESAQFVALLGKSLER